MKRIEAQLKQAWFGLAPSFKPDAQIVENCFERLLAAYSEPQRHYHTLQHIARMLRLVEQLRESARDVRVVNLAVWFHDAVYNPQRRDNEERSADLAETEMARLNVPAGLRGRVRRLILATKTHRGRGADLEVLLDADLAILAAAPSDYDAYAQAIRKEYAFVEESAYRQGRAQVLESFLNRTHLFRTTVMRRREPAARRNLKRELKRLQSKA